MPPRPVPEDALVDDAPGGATAASIAELEKRLTAQAEALEKRLAEQFEAATAALLARLAPPVQSPPPKGTQPAIPAGAPAPEGGEQGAQEPLPAELDALDTELEYVDFAYFGQVPPSGLEPPPRDGDEPRLWILTNDDTELENRLTAQAEALEKRPAEQFEAATAALLARLAPPVQPPPPEGTQPAIPAGAPAPEGGEQGAQEPLPAELDALDTELEYVDFAYFGQVPPSGLEPPPRDGDEPRLWILTDDTAARSLAGQRGLTAYDKYLYLRCYAKACGQSLAVRPSLQYSVQYLGRPSRARRPRPGSGAPWMVSMAAEPHLLADLSPAPACRPSFGASPRWSLAAWSFSATPTDWLRDACLAAGAQPPPVSPSPTNMTRLCLAATGATGAAAPSARAVSQPAQAPMRAPRAPAPRRRARKAVATRARLTEQDEEQKTAEAPAANGEARPTDASAAGRPRRIAYRLVAGLGVAGAAETGYLAWVKLSGGTALCLASGGCTSVLDSPYASLYGLPLPLLGAAAYGGVAALGALGAALGEGEDGSTSASASTSLALRDGLVAGASVLATTSAALMTVLATRLGGELCPWCLASAGLSGGIAATVAAGLEPAQRARAAPLAAGISASVLLTLGSAFSGISADAAGTAFSLPYNMPAVESHSSDAKLAMAKRLKAAGAKMYGAFWCSHCFAQKEYFGQEAMADFPYVECYPDGFFRSEDGKSTVIDQACSDIGIRGFPTWVINGQNYEGEQSLDNLEADLNK
eukprot:jgi/Tetstr1/439028/TSEL_027520.t1